jgi:hypothetical protein
MMEYRGKKKVEDTQIISAQTLRKTLTKYERYKTRKRLRRRAAIEPVIGALVVFDEINRGINQMIEGRGPL